MGIIIQNSGADYSSFGLGYASVAEEFINKAGVTDSGKKTAIRNLYNTLRSNGMWGKIYGMCLFAGTTSSTQKYYMSPAGVLELVFTGGTFDSGGYTPGSAGSSNGAITPFIAPAGEIVNWSMGINYASAESVASGSAAYLSMGVIGSNTGGAAGDHFIGLSRAYGSNSIHMGSCSQRNGGSFGNSTITNVGQVASTKTGFLQYIKAGDNTYLIDDATTIKSAVVSTFNHPIGGGTAHLAIGNRTNAANTLTANSTGAKLSFAYWGYLSAAEAASFDGIVKTFLTAFGR